MTEAAFAIWTCRATCKDGSLREVLAVYKGEQCLLVSRPWIGPCNVPLHALALRSRFGLLATLMSVADYHEHGGVWYGELATSWMAISALIGVSRNTMNSALTELKNLGYITYEPATNRWVPSLIRVLPVCQKTGDAVLQVGESWLRQWVAEIEPLEAVHTVEIKEKAVDHLRQAAAIDCSDIAAVVSGSPIYIPDAGLIQPKSWAAIKLTGGNLELYNKMRAIPGFESALDLTVGMDAGTDTSLPAQELGRKEVDPKQTWVREGHKVEVRDHFDPPQASQVGAANLPAQKGWRHPKRALYSNDHEGLEVSSNRGASPKGLTPRAEPSAPPPPPAAALPLASALFVGHRSERQLQPGQVEKVLRDRGARLDHSTRMGLTTAQCSCIDYYERASGVPFCLADLPHLNRALEIATHSRVLMAIKDSSVKWPPTCPGYYIVTDGMKHVLNVVEGRWKKKAEKGRGTGRAVSATDPEKAKKRLLARQGAAKARAGVPEASEAPIAQGEAPAPSREPQP